MLSDEISDVSSVPGRDVWNSCRGKLLILGFHASTRSTQKYCAPTLELRFSHFGFSASAGGFTGFGPTWQDRKSTRLNSSHLGISYAVFCLKKKKKKTN